MTQNNDDNEGQKPVPYDVGYKKPPKHTQFQPGHRGGNRKGRHKNGEGNLATAVQRAAGKVLAVDSAGKKIKMQAREYVATGIVNRAAKGNAKDIALLAKLDNAPIAPSPPSENHLAPPVQASKTIEEASASYHAALQRTRSSDE